MLSATWPQRLIAYNRHAFPDSTPVTTPPRHFFIGCHDASGEFLAEDRTLEITGDSYETALQEAVKPTCGMSPG